NVVSIYRIIDLVKVGAPVVPAKKQVRHTLGNLHLSNRSSTATVAAVIQRKFHEIGTSSVLVRVSEHFGSKFGQCLGHGNHPFVWEESVNLFLFLRCEGRNVLRSYVHWFLRASYYTP